MTVDEAITIVTLEQKTHHTCPSDIIGQAELLLIEAGKRLKDWRQGTVLNPDLLLPGETE